MSHNLMLKFNALGILWTRYQRLHEPFHRQVRRSERGLDLSVGVAHVIVRGNDVDQGIHLGEGFQMLDE